MTELVLQQEPPQHGSLMEAMLAFQAEAPKIAKEKTAEVVSKRTGGKYTYKFTPLADIMAGIQSLLTKHGLVWTCEPGENEQGKPILAYELVHVPSWKGSTLGVSPARWCKAGTMPLMLAAQDSQAHGSALTYAKRQALEAVLNLVAEADDDGKAASKRAAGDERLLPKAKREKMLEQIAASGKDLQTILTSVGAERSEDVTIGQAREIQKRLAS